MILFVLYLLLRLLERKLTLESSYHIECNCAPPQKQIQLQAKDTSNKWIMAASRMKGDRLQYCTIQRVRTQKMIPLVSFNLKNTPPRQKIFLRCKKNTKQVYDSPNRAQYARYYKGRILLVFW